MIERKNHIIMALMLSAVVLTAETLHSSGERAPCPPTQPDALGPYYKPGAPVRESVGKGYTLTGTVKSSSDCTPVSSAKIEFWLTGPDGSYDDDHRATVYSGKRGEYLFESNVPGPYFWRKPHIHIQVTAAGFRTLITQHYPEKGMTAATFDLVLVPAN